MTFKFADNPVREWEARVAALGAEYAAIDEWRARATGRLLAKKQSMEVREAWARQIDAVAQHMREAMAALYVLHSEGVERE